MDKPFILLDTPATADGQLLASEALQVALYSAPSPLRPQSNEDAAAAFLVQNHGGVFVVVDGMGGMANGLQAAAAVISAFAAEAAGLSVTETQRDLILNAIEKSNQDVLALNSGAVVAVVEVNKNILRSYHVGDAEILVTGQRGKIKLRTVSHSPVGYGVEAGLLDQQEALHHDERHLLLNMIGCQHMRIEVGAPVPLARHDTVLLASDGVFDNMRVEEIVEIIRAGTLQQAMTHLAELCRQRMALPDQDNPSKPDDMTFILLRRNS